MDTPSGNDTTAEAAPKAGINNDLAERAETISTALRGIFEAIVKSKKDGSAPNEIELADHAFTLVYCGLVALTEIAAAQTELVALAHRDFVAEVANAAKAQAEEIKANESKRTFIGQKP